MTQVLTIQQQVSSQALSSYTFKDQAKLDRIERQLITSECYPDGGVEMRAAGALAEYMALSERSSNLKTTHQSVNSIVSAMTTESSLMDELLKLTTAFTSAASGATDDASLTASADNFLKSITALANTSDARGGFLFGDSGMPVQVDLTNNANSNLNGDGTINTNSNFF